MSFVAALRRARVVAILRRPDIGETVDELCDQLVAAGVRAMEVTLDQPASLAALERLVGRAPAGTIVGAGTVMSQEQLDRAVDAGAAFAVCPHLDVELVAAASRRGLDILPGVTTASEVATARAAGAQVLKLFPAGPLTPAYLRALLGPFPEVGFVPTGGIAVHEVASWLEAGALAVGVGSALVGPGGVDPGLAPLLGDDA